MSEPLEYSGAFQNRILRVLSEDPNLCASVASYLKPGMFSGLVRQWAAYAMMSHVKQHGVRADREALRIRLRRDLKTKRLKPEFKDAAVAIIEKLQLPAKDKSFVRDEIFRFAKNRLSENSIIKAAEYAQQHDHDAMDAEIQKILDFNTARQGGMGMFYASSLEKRKQYRKEDVTTSGISTGTNLDNFIRQGGPWPKSLTCIVGGFGRGKTTSMVSMTCAAILETHKKALYVTIDEADEFAIGDRFDARFADTPMQDLVAEEDTVTSVVDGLVTKYGEFLVIKEFPPATITVANLRSYIRQLESKSFYPDLVVVDYADKMLPSIVRDKDYDNHGNIYDELRKMAIEEKLIVITAAQLNREGMGREIATGRDIGDSIKKAQIADLMFVVNQTAKERKEGKARWWVEKNRGGASQFEINVRLDFATQTVS